MTFDKNKKGHLVPPILVDYAERLMAEQTAEIRENYAIRLEAVRDYCNHILDIHQKSKVKAPRKNAKQRVA